MPSQDNVIIEQNISHVRADNEAAEKILGAKKVRAGRNTTLYKLKTYITSNHGLGKQTTTLDHEFISRAICKDNFGFYKENEKKDSCRNVM